MNDCCTQNDSLTRQILEDLNDRITVLEEQNLELVKYIESIRENLECELDYIVDVSIAGLSKK